MNGVGTLFTVAMLAAPSSSLELRWSAPAECPSKEAVERQVAEALAGFEGPTRPVAADAVVEAVLVKSGRAYDLQLDIQMETVTASRSIRASDCSLLADTTGLIVAVALDPETSAEELSVVMEVRAATAEDSAPVENSSLIPLPEALPTLADPPAPSSATPSPQPLPTAFEEPQPAAPPPVQPSERTRPPPPIDAALRVFGGAGAGVLPGIGGGLGLGLAITGRFWRAEVQGSYWFSRRVTFDGESSIGGDFSLWSGGARGCGVPTIRRLEIPVCAGAELGQIRGQGFGAPENLDTTSLWAAVVLAPSVVWLPRPWIGLFAGVDGFINVVRPGFKGQQRPELHRVAPAAVRLLGGIELRIGTRVLEAKKPG